MAEKRGALQGLAVVRTTGGQVGSEGEGRKEDGRGQAAARAGEAKIEGQRRRVVRTTVG